MVIVKRKIPILLIAFMLAMLFFVPTTRLEAATVNRDLITDTEVNEMKASITYYVDNQHPNKSDQKEGLENEPFVTIGQALRRAGENRKKDNKGTRIIIKPGIYREALKLQNILPNEEAPIIIEGTNKNEVFIRGSIVLKDPWVKEGDYYTHEWTMGWGPSADIYTEYNISMQEIIRRKEIIHVNGVRMAQVLTKEELAPGKLYVNNDEKKAYFMPFEGMEVKDDSVEVSIYDELLKLHETGDFLVKNITFQHANSYHTGSAVSFYKVSNMVIQDCDIMSNNWAALGVFDAKNVTIDRVRMNGNGGTGLQGAGLDNIIVRDSETSGNNWRGAMGNFFDWDTGGIKLLFTYDCAIIRHQAYDNQAPGIWFDSECRNIIIQDCIVIGNDHEGNSVSAGLYIEGNLGPTLIENCIIRENHRGLNLASSNDVTIRNTQIVDNRLEQIAIFGNWGQGRTFKARFEEGDATSFPINNIFENVVISAGADNTEPLMNYDHSDKGGYIVWLKASTWNNVSIHHPTPETAFLLDDSETRGNYDQWTAAFNKEAKWVPASPLNLKIEKKENTADLTWDKPNDNIEGYIVYFNGKEIARTENTAFTHTLEQELDNGAYEVAAYKGDAISGRSNYVAFKAKEDEANDDTQVTDGKGNSKNNKFLSKKNLVLLLSIITIGLVFGFGAAIGISLNKNKKRKTKKD